MESTCGALRLAALLKPLHCSTHDSTRDQQPSRNLESEIATTLYRDAAEVLMCSPCSMCTMVASVRPVRPEAIRVFSRSKALGCGGSMTAAEWLRDVTSAIEIGAGGSAKVYCGLLCPEPQDSAGAIVPVALKVMCQKHSDSQLVRHFEAIEREARVCDLIMRAQVGSLSRGAMMFVRPFGVLASGCPAKAARQAAGKIAAAASESRVAARPCHVHHLVFVQELCTLGSLNHLLTKRRRIAARSPPFSAENEVCAVAASVASALQFLHGSLKVMHRDIKPHNIFLTQRQPALGQFAPGFERVDVLLGDLGLSRDGECATTFCGTPKYIAPEVGASQMSFSLSGTSRVTSSSSPRRTTYSHSCDVYSLGVTLQAMLLGTDSPGLGKQWVLPSAVPSSRQSLSTDVFVVPADWLCGDTSCERCCCQNIHPKLVSLLNEMVSVHPTLRPTPESILHHPCLRKHSRVSVQLLRDTLWSGRDPDWTSVTARLSGGGSTVEVVQHPVLYLSSDEIETLQSTTVADKLKGLPSKNAGKAFPLLG